VLTSYIVAAAHHDHAVGFPRNQIRPQARLMAAVVGFVVASVLCGIAQSLVQIVAFDCCKVSSAQRSFRLASLFCSTFIRWKKRGSAMALFGVSVMVGPVLGPVIGGWLTDHYSWRWVFYINVPLGALAFAGIIVLSKRDETSAATKLDWLGFGSLSVAIATMQVFLDRGAQT